MQVRDKYGRKMSKTLGNVIDPLEVINGITLAALFVPMVVSGYALQVSVEERWRDVWIGLHLATALIWRLMAAVHLLALLTMRAPACMK